MKNQCDGCARGLPVDENGIHHDEQMFGICCTADRYGHPVRKKGYKSLDTADSAENDEGNHEDATEAKDV